MADGPCERRPTPALPLHPSAPPRSIPWTLQGLFPGASQKRAPGGGTHAPAPSTVPSSGCRDGARGCPTAMRRAQQAPLFTHQTPSSASQGYWGVGAGCSCTHNPEWVPVWRPQPGAASQKLHEELEVSKRRAGSRNRRCRVGGDSGPTGSRRRALMRQHCTSHPRQGITRHMGSPRRTFKGENSPFPSLLLRQG